VTGLAVSQGILAQPGTVAFLVVFGLAVMLFFWFRSMARHLRKVNQAAREAAESAADAESLDGSPGPSANSAGNGSADWR